VINFIKFGVEYNPDFGGFFGRFE